MVFGGTSAALLISYRGDDSDRPRDGRRLRDVAGVQNKLVAQFADYSLRVRRNGVLVLEPGDRRPDDPLSLARSPSWSTASRQEVKHSLEVDSRTREDADEERTGLRGGRRLCADLGSWAPCWA